MSKLSDQQKKQLLDALPQLRRFCMSLTGRSADADDLLQATVERVLQKGISGDAEPLRWAYRVCKNIWIDEIRSREVRSRAADTLAEDSEDQPEMDRVVEGEIRAERVRSALSTLPDDQRLVLVLVTIEGRSYAETADILDIPTGTVMSRLARARSALADMLNERGDNSHA